MELIIFITAVAGSTILWRTIKNDHPALKKAVASIPYIGESLGCGVCTSYWFTLIALFVRTPLSVTSVMDGLFVWIGIGTCVLALRSMIIVSLEAAAVLSHRHRSIHN